jgi:lipopolysaccharide transport system permease protein
MSEMENEEWTDVIQSQTKWFDFHLDQIWQFRDLLFLFVKRDFVAVYKQTILGPLWFFIQPIFSTIIFTVIFGTVAKIPTDGMPPTLFYMAGITAWNYFADCLNRTSTTFTANAGIFGKVYFPRMIVPISNVISSLIKFGIQFLLFLVFVAFYYFKGASFHPNRWMFFTPVLLLIMAGIGLGFGIIISSLTTKYRDLQYLMGFGVQLLMYATPIVYPLSILHGKLRIIALLNPMTPIVETFKYAFLGGGGVNLIHLGYSVFIMFLLLFLGLLIFNRIEKSFMDTV